MLYLLSKLSFLKDLTRLFVLIFKNKNVALPTLNYKINIDKKCGIHNFF